MSIKRSYFTAPVEYVELHIHMFVDSSENVFRAVAFLRARVKISLEKQVAFVFGKLRVAPIMKSITYPYVAVRRWSKIIILLKIISGIISQGLS